MAFTYDDDVPRTTRSVKLGPPDKRVENTLTHVSRGWLPPNPEKLNTVKKNISAPHTAPRATLIECVKGDPGLFLLTARSLPKILTSVAGGINPLQELVSLEEDKLHQIFSLDEEQISLHSLSSITRPQATALQNVLLASHAADAMASHLSLSEANAFSIANFRQLGLNLIAWNYPRMYSQYVHSGRYTSAEIDREFLKLLGLSPLQVGARLASTWGVHPEVRSLIEARPSSELIHSTDKTPHAKLLEVIEISELFARLKDPATSKLAESEWKKRESYIASLIPSNLLEGVAGQVRDVLGGYSKISEVICSLPLAPRNVVPLEESAKELAKKRALANSYVSRCPPEIQAAFISVYEAVEESTISVTAIQRLVGNTIPIVGFSRGCLFLVGKDGRTLVPSLRIGDRPLGEYTHFLSDPETGISSSIYTAAPYCGSGIGITGKETLHVSGAFDGGVHLGLLYLEYDDLMVENPNFNPSLLFNAIRKAMLDTLNGAH